MVAMKKTLLELVQDMLEELDGDQVNSIDDTIEATQIATIIANVYFDLIANRVIPEHNELIRLEALGDSTRPNYLKLPSDVDHIPSVFEYNKSVDSPLQYDYREVLWEDPMRFLARTATRDSSSSDIDTVLDINGSTELLIINNKMPDFFTSFDDLHIVCDSYDSALDDTLQASKTRAWAKKIPTVTIVDTFTFDIDSHYFPYLYNEALSRASIAQKSSEHPKAEQWARRHKSFIQSQKYRIEQPNRRPNYGRVGALRRPRTTNRNN